MEDWKTIISFTYPHEAHIAKSLLESEGIEIIIRDELTAQINNFYSNAIGGVKLLARESEIEKGLEVLKKGGFIDDSSAQLNNEIHVVLRDMSTDIRFCPFCKSKNIGKKKQPDAFIAIIYMLLGVFLPMFKRTYICFNCGKEYKFVKKQ